VENLEFSKEEQETILVAQKKSLALHERLHQRSSMLTKAIEGQYLDTWNYVTSTRIPYQRKNRFLMRLIVTDFG
jgi:hypothetical protein